MLGQCRVGIIRYICFKTGRLEHFANATLTIPITFVNQNVKVQGPAVNIRTWALARAFWKAYVCGWFTFSDKEISFVE